MKTQAVFQAIVVLWKIEVCDEFFYMKFSGRE